MKQQTKQLWGAAFSQTPSEAVISFAAGRDVAPIPASDTKLIPYDIWLNEAHCLMLAKQGIIPVTDAKKILKGLSEIEKLASAGKFILDPKKEDVHTNIESWLTKKYGIEAAGKLHTARSRNDQVVTDVRMYLRDQVLAFIDGTTQLAIALLSQAKKHEGTVMPGFTHHQHAMVTTYGHMLTAFAAMMVRDAKRFSLWFDLHNSSPLGSSTSYGTLFPLDRAYSAKLLGFDGAQVNSLDPVTNRWEPEADLAYAIVILMNHLSLMAQTLILLSTPEFGMTTVADQFSTGSSVMPQKKNPDPLEVIKGKAAYAQGTLTGLLGIGKSNFIGYNRDSQWTKYMVMDVISECILAPVVMKGVIESLTVNKEVMLAWSKKGFIGATSLMEQITGVFGLPMRKAKVIIEKGVKYSKGHEIVTFEALQQALTEENITIAITASDVAAWQDPERIIGLTKVFGGPGIQAGEKAVRILSKDLKDLTAWSTKMQHALHLAHEATIHAISKLISGGK
ncbi:MAG TPA: argininosuccinate lyase [Patescibacteria group bacterium]|nr:argininosuccinate lyase [Patescibacteria group bacterium]